MVEQCLIATYEPGSLIPVKDSQCPRPGKTNYEAACVHEHVDKGRLCKVHVNSFYGAIVVCGTCQSIDGHRCVMRVTYGTIS